MPGLLTMDKATTDPAVLPNRLSTAPLSDDASVQFSAQRLSGLHQVTKPVIEYRITTTTFPADSLYPVLKVYPPTNSTYSQPSEPSGLKAFNITGSRAGPPLLPVTTHRADDTDTEPMPSHKALRCFAFQPARFTKGGLSYGGCHMTSPSTLETDFEETTVPSPGIELAVQTALLYDEWNVREQLARLFIPTEQRNEGRIRPQKGWRPGEREYRSAAFGVVDVAGTSVWRSSYGIWRLVDGGEDEVVDLTCHSLDAQHSAGSGTALELGRLGTMSTTMMTTARVRLLWSSTKLFLSACLSELSQSAKELYRAMTYRDMGSRKLCLKRCSSKVLFWQ